MRILYHHRTLADGAEGIHIRAMVDALRQLNHTVRVVSLVDDGSGHGGRQTRWNWLRRCMPAVGYEFAELGYNVVGARLLQRAIAEFNPDVIYDRYNSYCTASLIAGRRAGVPVLLEVNAPHAYERTTDERIPLRMPWLARRYERRICGQADHVFAVSTPLKDYLVSQLGVSGDRITVLPNGADPARFDPQVSGARVAAEWGLEGRIVLGFTGILRPWHGLELLIRAFAALSVEHHQLHLHIVGDGPMQAELERLVRETGMSRRVTFTGRVSHEEVAEHVAAMDIAVSPRATFYASPMKILEYMAMAKAIVAPRMPNIEDIVEDGHTAMLFKPESTEALAVAIRALVRDAALRQRLGRQARQAVETQFNWIGNAREAASRAQQILSGRASGDVIHSPAAGAAALANGGYRGGCE